MAVGAAVPADRAPDARVDQATLGVFRALMGLQFLTAGFFGFFPFLAPLEFARLFSLIGDEPYLYRLAGAAAIGYSIAALVALFRATWRSIRIPVIASFTFNLAAAGACLLAIDESGVGPLPALVAIAATLFTALSAYWLRRDDGERAPQDEELEPAFRVILGLATVAASVFGLAPLLLPRTFASFLAISDADLVMIRLAGAATLGYAVAGAFQLLANRWPEIRIQVIAAIVFNALSAVASAIYLAGGGPSILGLVVLPASAFFTFALTAFAARAAR